MNVIVFIDTKKSASVGFLKMEEGDSPLQQTAAALELKYGQYHHPVTAVESLYGRIYFGLT